MTGTRVEQPVSLRDRVYVDLGKKLMVGEIDHRTRLVETQLCETLDVSRTPLREALVRLHADGMLERRPDGYYPVALDIAGVRDLYELRVTIELRGIARILETDELQYDKDRLAALRAEWAELKASPPRRRRTWCCWTRGSISRCALRRATRRWWLRSTTSTGGSG